MRYLILMRRVQTSGLKSLWQIATVGTIATRESAEMQMAEFVAEWTHTEFCIVEVPA